MNKNFDGDKKLKWINKDWKETIMKFYQATVKIPELTNRNRKLSYNLYGNYWDVPEATIKNICFDNLDESLLRIIDKLKVFTREEKNVIITPVITVRNFENTPNGHYIIDLKENKMVKYKEIEDTFYEKNEFDIIVSYFIDVDYAVYVNQEQGFIDGILQVGKLTNEVSKIQCFEEFESDEIFTKQQYTYKLGLNCRKQLYVNKQFLRGK